MKLDQVRLAVAHPESLAPLTKVKQDNGEPPKRFDLWPHQIEIIRAVLAHRQVIILKARQLGVSWVFALIALWWVLSKPGQTVIIVSIGDREAKTMMARVRFLYDSLAPAVRAAYPLGLNNQSQLEIAHASGTATVMSLPSSSTAGSGETAGLLIGDERPKWPHPEEQEASLFPAAAMGHKAILGTAQGMDGFYDRWMASEDNGWHPIFVGALARPDRTEEWVEVERSNQGELGPQEYPLTASEAFLASGRCAFDRDALARTEQVSCEPAKWRGILHRDAMGIRPDALDEGNWWVWEWPEQGRDYVLVADPCGGTATGDYAAAAMYETTTWEQVAAYHGRPEPAAFAAELVKAGWLYALAGRPALLVPEANNHGQAVVALLGQWGYPRVYQSETFDQKTNRRTVRLGWTTDAKTRGQAISALQAGLRQGTLAIRDRAAIAEMHRFIWRETPTGGRWEAGEGAHDDRVMAHAIAAAVLSLSAATTPPSAPIVQPVVPSDSITGYVPG